MWDERVPAAKAHPDAFGGTMKSRRLDQQAGERTLALALETGDPLLVDSPVHLRKRFDPQTGLALLVPDL